LCTQSVRWGRRDSNMRRAPQPRRAHTSIHRTSLAKGTTTRHYGSWPLSSGPYTNSLGHMRKHTWAYTRLYNIARHNLRCQISSYSIASEKWRALTFVVVYVVCTTSSMVLHGIFPNPVCVAVVRYDLANAEYAHAPDAIPVYPAET